MKLVKDHLTPQPSSIVQRFKFNSRSQQDTETVAQFVAELKKLSEYCEFGDSLDNMLRDRLVCGLRDVKVQRRLLAEGKLTFAKAFELAQVAELTDKNVADLQRPQTPEAVHAVKRSGSPPQNSCFRCRGRDNILSLVEVSTRHPTVGLRAQSATAVGKKDTWSEPVAKRFQQAAGFLRRVKPTNWKSPSIAI